MTASQTALTRQTILENLLAFKRTSMLRTALELRLFDALAGGARHPDDVATSLGVPERGIRVLLGALASAGLVVSRDGRYALVEGADRLLVSDGPEYAGGAALVAASYAEWDALRDLTAVVRKGGTLLDTHAGSPDFAYWRDFATHGTFATRPVARVVGDVLQPWAADRAELRVLDVGCGHGLFGLLLAERHPHAHVTGVDWEPVLVHARRNAETMGLADRTTLLAGDAFTADLGGPYDLIVVANLIPQFSADEATGLLRRLAGALAPCGRVVVAGFTVGDQPPAREYGAHMLSLLMLAWTAGGEVPTTPAYLEMLRAAGYAGTGVHDVPGLPTRVFVARVATDGAGPA